MPDQRDNCPATANPDQADGDRAAVGDACDPSAPGNVPAVAIAQAVEGDVLVELPGSARFVSLAGVVSLPVGTTIDARKGRVGLTSAASSNRIATPGRGTFGAAVFSIRQRRLRLAERQARTAAQIVIRIPPGLARAGGPRPLTGVVRTARKRDVTVRAGRPLLVRAKLFAARTAGRS